MTEKKKKISLQSDKIMIAEVVAKLANAKKTRRNKKNKMLRVELLVFIKKGTQEQINKILGANTPPTENPQNISNKHSHIL